MALKKTRPRHPAGAKQKLWELSLSPEERKELADSIRQARRDAYRSSSYVLNRTISRLERESGINLLNYVNKILPRRGRLSVLDCGAGLLGVSADLKKNFKDRIFLTALNPFMIPETAKGKKVDEQKLLEGILKHDVLKNPIPTSAPIQDRKSAWIAAHKRRGLLDDYRVGIAQLHRAKRKYDLILDIQSALQYGKPTKRILMQYASLLNPGGRIFVFGTHTAKVVARHFGPNSKYAKKSGHYLSHRWLNEKYVRGKLGKMASTTYAHGVYEITKVPLSSA